MQFPPQVETDMAAFYRLHNPSKVSDIPTILVEAAKRSITEDEIFDSLYNKYNIKKLPDRVAVLARLAAAVPGASPADVRSALRQTELGALAEADALRLLRRSTGAPSPPPAEVSRSGSLLPSLTAGPQTPAQLQGTANAARSAAVHLTAAAPAATETPKMPMRARALTATVSRAKVDEIMCGELRDWLMLVLGDDFNGPVAAASNVVDCLRDGALLTILGQKIRNPNILKADVKLPRSTQGFYARENVSRFLKEARTLFSIRPEVLFTDADLCDRKNDRAVVNCLLAVAAAAYRSGAVQAAPAVVVYDKEIEEQTQLMTDDAVEKAIQATMHGEEEGDPAAAPATEQPPLDAVVSDKKIPEDTVEKEVPSPDVASENVEVAEAEKRETPQIEEAPLLLGPDAVTPPQSRPKPVSNADTRPVYRPLASDDVDKHVSTAVNALMQKHTRTQARIKRLAHQGQYVVYHRITGKRTVVYVRVVQKNLMIRVGGGWDVFSDWLSRHLVECDNVMLPPGK
jgi:hypothetical protein